MILTLHIALVLAVLWALVERLRRSASADLLKDSRELRAQMQEGSDRDQKAWLIEMRRADRAEAALRRFGHEIPSEDA